jgi:hypothetical protein
MPDDVSLVRLYVLRCMYLLDALMLGGSVWPDLVRHFGWADPLQGVAPSFWAALSLLALVGVRHPLKMLPLLLIQFTYKLIWMIWIWLPLHAAGGSTYLTKPMLMGAILEPLIIPWPYVVRAYITSAGERWTNKRPESGRTGVPAKQNVETR